MIINQPEKQTVKPGRFLSSPKDLLGSADLELKIRMISISLLAFSSNHVQLCGCRYGAGRALGLSRVEFSPGMYDEMIT